MKAIGLPEGGGHGKVRGNFVVYHNIEGLIEDLLPVYLKDIFRKKYPKPNWRGFQEAEKRRINQKAKEIISGLVSISWPFNHWSTGERQLPDIKIQLPGKGLASLERSIRMAVRQTRRREWQEESARYRRWAKDLPGELRRIRKEYQAELSAIRKEGQVKLSIQVPYVGPATHSDWYSRH